jgi:drug/metabolite transporter (DMT)-like permease
LVSSACFGTLAVFTSLAYERGALPLQLLSWRFFLAAVLLGGYLAITDPRKLRAPFGDVGKYAIISIGGYGAASICFFFALTYADAGVVSILLYTYPAMVVLAERLLFGVPLDAGRAGALALTFAGCLLVVAPFTGDVHVGLPGVVLGLGAAAAYTLFGMVSHRRLPGRPRTTLMVYLFFFTSLMAGAAALLTSTPLGVASWDAVTWALLAGIVLLPTFVAILLYLRAIHGLGAGQAAIVSTFEPVFTIVMAALLLGEKLAPVQIAGAACVLLGVVVAERSGRAAEEPAIV